MHGFKKVVPGVLGCKGHTRYLGIHQTCVVFLAVASVNQSLFIIAGQFYLSNGRECQINQRHKLYVSKVNKFYQL